MTQGQPIPILFPAAMVILDKEVQGKGQDGSVTSDLSALPLPDLASSTRLALSFSCLPPVISLRLSCASKDGYNTENDVHL